jgi:hypothetical protein
MRRALMSLVVGAALTIGTQGAAFAATPASPTIDVRQSVVDIDPSSTITVDEGSLSNQTEKSEPDSDTNSGSSD